MSIELMVTNVEVSFARREVRRLGSENALLMLSIAEPRLAEDIRSDLEWIEELLHQAQLSRKLDPHVHSVILGSIISAVQAARHAHHRILRDSSRDPGLRDLVGTNSPEE